MLLSKSCLQLLHMSLPIAKLIYFKHFCFTGTFSAPSHSTCSSIYIYFISFLVEDPEAEEILSNIVDFVSQDDNPNDEAQVKEILGAYYT